MFVGQFLDWANFRLAHHKRIICREFFIGYLPSMRLNLGFMYTTSLIYMALLYFLGRTIFYYESLILAPMLILVFTIDYKKHIIPNRLTLSLFELGLIFAFFIGFANASVNFNIFLNYIYGMIAGGGIFLLITLIGGLIAGKEAMGFGDVKLMASLGLIFGLFRIIEISLISFLLAAIVGIILIIFRRKKSSGYMPFGPFIVIGAFITMLVPQNILLNVLYKIFTLGLF